MKKKELGAIVVEATISLTAFIFAIFTVLMVVNIAYVQSKMGVALNEAAKEISQYCYLYYATGADGLDKKAADGTQQYRATADQTIDGVNAMYSAFTGAVNSAAAGDFGKMSSDIEAGNQTASSLYNTYSEQIGDDPKTFIMGMAKMAGNEIKEEGKTALFGQVLGKSFMKKNLKASNDDDPDAFLRRYHVVNGLDGLDFNYSSFMVNGESSKIQLVVTYEVEVIKLLNLDYTFRFRQAAMTTAWGNGVSKINPESSTKQTAPDQPSIWDAGGGVRGKTIVDSEKKNYEYTASGNGYDAYNNDNGANEYISIISINTHDKTAMNVDTVEGKIAGSFNDMYAKIDWLDDTITVKDKDGKEVQLNSEKATRTYKIVVVVPEDADITVVEQAKQEFIKSHSGFDYTVDVEIKKGYGSPTQNKNTLATDTVNTGN